MRVHSSSSYQNTAKFFLPSKDVWEKEVLGQTIRDIRRLGKNLWVNFEGADKAWHIHLRSTGWFMPAPGVQATVDPIHENFLHKVAPENVRLTLSLDDGTRWNYHDSRTWGKWAVQTGPDPRDCSVLKGLGPDWLAELGKATKTLENYSGAAKVADVLQNQAITAGLGHYMANEICYVAKIHPHTKWKMLSPAQKEKLAASVWICLGEAWVHADHSHWGVFTRRNKPCRRCNTPIRYDKRSKDQGDYYCPKCQERG